MNARRLVGPLATLLALGAAALAAACGDADQGTLGPGGVDSRGGDDTSMPGDPAGGDETGGPAGSTGGGSGAGPTPVDQTPSPDTPAKKYFTSTVYPTLSATCGTCHETGPGPAWISKTDVEVSYKMQFQRGYVSPTSAILTKGPHNGGTAPALTSDQTQKFTTWVQMELSSAAPGKAPVNVLEKIGACFDRDKFDAMNLDDMRTIRRDDNNNENKVKPWEENGNNCTGCNNAPCRVCHSGDDATAFVNAEGNNLLPRDYTFENSKLSNPAYVTKYFGVSPTGEPIASEAIKAKAVATSKDKAYTHPYFRVGDQMDARIKAFVDDAIAKYKATNGACK